MRPGPSIVQWGEKASKEVTYKSEKTREAKKVSKEGRVNYIMPLRDERS